MKRTIKENEVGVLIRKGKFIRKLSAGRYRYGPLFFKEEIRVLDARTKFMGVASSCLTSDHSTVTINSAASYIIKDPLEYLKTVENESVLIRALASDVIRAAVMTKSLDDLLASQAELQKEMQKELEKRVAGYGIKLEGLSPLSVILPRNLKAAVEGELVARKKSQADLEEARGRTAVLRHYANAAKLVADQPELLKLLLGQKAKSLQVQFSDEKASKN